MGKHAVDTSATVQLWTPGSMIVGIPAGHIAVDSVRNELAKNTPEGDANAALYMARLTKLTVTIKRETQTTVRVSDLEA